MAYLHIKKKYQFSSTVGLPVTLSLWEIIVEKFCHIDKNWDTVPFCLKKKVILFSFPKCGIILTSITLLCDGDTMQSPEYGILHKHELIQSWAVYFRSSLISITPTTLSLLRGQPSDEATRQMI
jgi:hypothetical protein